MNRGRTTLGGTDREIRATLAALLSDLNLDAEYELRHEHFVADMPQSGERAHGCDAMRELQRTFPLETKRARERGGAREGGGGSRQAATPLGQPRGGVFGQLPRFRPPVHP
jgi:hypothetical protein